MAMRRGLWSIAVPVVTGLAGLLFATTAVASGGSDLRAGPVEDLPDVIRSRALVVAEKSRQISALREHIDGLNAQLAHENPQLAQRVTQERTLAAQAGLEPVSGTALRVELIDAPTGGRIPEGYTVDDVVVHQQDVQAVVNALWAAGAEAMMIADQRVVSTSAVRCVGNTLILQGRVYSPPYVITAIGDPATLRDGLEGDPQVRVYREYVAEVGLGYRVSEPGVVTMPAFAGSLELRHARVER